jgi:outer membrane biosynthesis protein TonB
METVRYLRRINLGNYEHEEAEATSAIGDNETIEQAIARVKAKVNNALRGIVEEEKKEIIAANVVIQEEEEVQEMPEVIEEEMTPPPVPEEAKVEEKPKRTRKPKAKPDLPISMKEAPAADAKNVTFYDRNKENHKALFVELVTEIAPDWRATDASKALVKQLSLDMEGHAMLDNKSGDVLDSFVKALRNNLK